MHAIILTCLAGLLSGSLGVKDRGSDEVRWDVGAVLYWRCSVLYCIVLLMLQKLNTLVQKSRTPHSDPSVSVLPLVFSFTGCDGDVIKDGVVRSTNVQTHRAVHLPEGSCFQRGGGES